MLNYWNYSVWRFCKLLAIAERETPSWRATSARDSPNSATSRCASKARIFDTDLRRLPACSSRALTPACRQTRSIASDTPDWFLRTASCRRIRSSASRSTVATKTSPPRIRSSPTICRLRPRTTDQPPPDRTCRPPTSSGRRSCPTPLRYKFAIGLYGTIGCFAKPTQHPPLCANIGETPD